MKTVKIAPSDNVIVALEDLCTGDIVDGIQIKENIPAGHKAACKNINAGEEVIKYGNVIGYAVNDILPGYHVHTHNIRTSLGGIIEYEYNPSDAKVFSSDDERYFDGYIRKNGKVGIRNEIWIIPTVGCVNSVAEEIKNRTSDFTEGSVDGVYAYTHPYGCSQLGEDNFNTQKALCGLISHPNAGGVLVLGLGCENNNIDEMKKVLGEYDSERVVFLNCQDTDDEIAEGVMTVKSLIDTSKEDKREKVPLSELVIGLKCGGSDGFSGITANPCVGVLSDKIVSFGGSTILTEVPEMFGAEKLLMDRCENKELFDKTVKMINDFKEYFMKYNQVIYENPSPGNKKGGISTLEDKSLGCTQKSGTSSVKGVLKYGEIIKEKGLNLLSAPGNDLVASTALAVSGAHIVLFTTGRGTPFGCPVPTVKISSNNRLYEHKNNWIDFNAGVIVNSGDIESCGEKLLDYVISLASGKTRTKNEINNYRGISIFKDGVTL